MVKMKWEYMGEYVPNTSSVCIICPCHYAHDTTWHLPFSSRILLCCTFANAVCQEWLLPLSAIATCTACKTYILFSSQRWANWRRTCCLLSISFLNVCLHFACDDLFVQLCGRTVHKNGTYENLSSCWSPPHFDLVLPVKLHIPASLPAGQPFIFWKPIAVASCIRSLTFLREIVSLEFWFAACDAWPIFYCTEGAQTSTSAWGLDHSGPQQKEDPDLVFRALTQIVLTNTSRCLVQGRTIIQWRHVSVQLWLRRMVESSDCSDAASHWRPRCQAYKTHSNSTYFCVACWHESRT